jgi:hypothetical protein
MHLQGAFRITLGNETRSKEEFTIACNHKLLVMQTRELVITKASVFPSVSFDAARLCALYDLCVADASIN